MLMRTKVNSDNNICIGYQVPDGDVNLAYIHADNTDVRQNINIVSNTYKTSAKEYVANPDENFILKHDGIYAFHTADIEITDQFALNPKSKVGTNRDVVVLNRLESAMQKYAVEENYLPRALYYRTKLKFTIDARTLSDNIAVYTTGYDGAPLTVKTFSSLDSLVYYGNKITVRRKYNISLTSTELYKIILRPVTNGRDYEYDCYVYTNFQGHDDIYYTVSYKAYGSSIIKNEIINPEPFFTKMCNTLVGINKLGFNMRVNNNGKYTNFDILTQHNQLNLIPHVRLNLGNRRYNNIHMEEESNTVQFNMPFHIVSNSGGTLTTTNLEITNTPIADIVTAYASGDESLLDTTQYAVEYLTNFDLYKLIIPSRNTTIDTEARPGKLFKYQIDGVLEAQYGDDNPKTINIGIIMNGGVDTSNAIININSSINSRLDRNINFENPNHSEYMSPLDGDYWTVDISSPPENLNRYDMILVTGTGTLSLADHGQKLVDYVNNGGKLWFDSCDTTDPLVITNWPVGGGIGLSFSNLNAHAGEYMVYKEDNDYLHTRYEIPLPGNHKADIENFITAGNPIAAAITDSASGDWTTIVHWTSTGWPSDTGMAIGTKEVGLGTVIASSCGITKSICGADETLLRAAAKLAFNVILENVRKVRVKSPYIFDRIYNINNLFPIEYEEKGYYKEPVNSVIVAKKLLAPSVRQMMTSYIPLEAQNAEGIFTITPYNLDGTPCTTIFMTGVNDGNEKLWAYNTIQVNDNFNLATKRFNSTQASTNYPDVEFDYSITAYAYEWNGTNFTEVEGDTISYQGLVNGSGPKTMMELDKLPPIGEGATWAIAKNIFYRLRLGKKEYGEWIAEDANVNIGFYDTSTGTYITDNYGRDILRYEDMYPMASANIYERYNSDFSLNSVGAFSSGVIPEGWSYNTAYTNIATSEITSDGVFHVVLDRVHTRPVYSTGYMYYGGIRKTDYDGNDIPLKPNTTYIMTMDIFINSGDPNTLISNGEQEIVLNLIDDLNATTGEWSTVTYEFTTSAKADADNWTFYPIYITSYDLAEVQTVDCVIRSVNLSPKSISKVKDIVVKAFTNEYNLLISDRKFAIRETQANDISVAHPDSEDIRDPWYVKIHNGRYTTNYYPDNNRNYKPSKCEYMLPEYSKQVYDPYFPYVREIEDSVVHLNKNIVKVNHGSILDGSLKLYRRTAKNSKVMLEKLITSNSINYASTHINWVDNPTPQLFRKIDDITYVPFDIALYYINYEDGTVEFEDVSNYDVYASYSYVVIEEISIRDIDLNNGIIHTYDNLDYKDDIFANYVYREEYIEYKGYTDTDGTFHELNLNPIYNPALYNNPNITIYMLPYLVNGVVTNETTVRHCLTRDFKHINQPMALRLADIRLIPTTDVTQVTIMDGRVKGGGLKKEITSEKIAATHQTSEHFWDISPWNGLVYQSNGVVVIDVPKKLLDTMSRGDVQNYVNKYLALGVYPIINYV